jgi:hypothetical protein
MMKWKYNLSVKFSLGISFLLVLVTNTSSSINVAAFIPAVGKRSYISSSYKQHLLPSTKGQIHHHSKLSLEKEDSTKLLPRLAPQHVKYQQDDILDSSKEQHLPFLVSRRQAITGNNFLSMPFLSALVISTTLNAASAQKSLAAVTDETNNFAMKDSAYVTRPNEMSSDGTTSSTIPTPPNDKNHEIGSVSPLSNSSSSTTITNTNASPTDEITITIPLSKLQSSSLGVELADVEFRTNRRVYIKSVLPSSLGAQYNIQPNYILVKINGKSAERTDARGVAMMISQVKQQTNIGLDANNNNLELTFRDDSSFQKQLVDLSNYKEATTQVAPAGDTTQRNQDGSIRSGYRETSQQDQRITVTQLIPPKLCTRGADIDDLLEISYVGFVLETGAVFDGSAIKIDGMGIPGRGNDVSIFFVLGKQPFGQFPPGWDVGLR